MKVLCSRLVLRQVSQASHLQLRCQVSEVNYRSNIMLSMTQQHKVLGWVALKVKCTKWPHQAVF